MKKKDEGDFLENIFALNFMGQELDLLVNIYHTYEEHSEAGTMSEQNPLAIRGFLLDIDENYLYLGDTPDGITKFVRKNLIAGGDIVKDKEDKFDAILNGLPTNGSAN